MIGVDWGTSNFRAFRIDDTGRITDRRSSAGGVFRVEQRGFADALMVQVGDWLQGGERRILISGMAGSRQGWKETRYLPCPVGVVDLADAAVEVPLPNAEVLLVPGVSGFDGNGVPEVMRGEETEVMGLLDSAEDPRLICLPGTHSKWIHVSSRRITSFITCMTGDVFAVLRSGTILSTMMTNDAPLDSHAFLLGVTRSADPAGILHHLFGVRTLALMEQLKEEASPSYLSGLLIGHEVRGVMPPGALVRLAGNAQLCSLYAQAISACGGSFTIEDEDAAARGLTAIARRLHWI
ncbi:MAG: 2-dehydro-3-deoxygalactonokinase [Acidobacteriaceae bacterium]